MKEKEQRMERMRSASGHDEKGYGAEQKAGGSPVRRSGISKGKNAADSASNSPQDGRREGKTAVASHRAARALPGTEHRGKVDKRDSAKQDNEKKESRGSCTLQG